MNRAMYLTTGKAYDVAKLPLRHSQCSVQPGEGVAILDFGSECFEVPVVMVDGLPEANPSESTLDALEEWLSDSEISDLMHRCEAVQSEQTVEAP